MLNLWHRTSILKRHEPNIAVLSLSIAVFDLFSAVLNVHNRLTSDFERGRLLANQIHCPASDCESGAHRITRIQAARWNHSTRCTSSMSIMNGKAAWLFAYFVLKEHAKKASHNHRFTFRIHTQNSRRGNFVLQILRFSVCLLLNLRTNKLRAKLRHSKRINEGPDSHLLEFWKQTFCPQRTKFHV